MEVTVKNVSDTGKPYYYLFDKKDLNLASVRRIMVEDGLEIPEKFYFLTKNGNILSRYQEKMFTVDQIYKNREILLKASEIENESLLDDPEEPVRLTYAYFRILLRNQFMSLRCFGHLKRQRPVSFVRNDFRGIVHYI